MVWGTLRESAFDPKADIDKGEGWVALWEKSFQVAKGYAKPLRQEGAWPSHRKQEASVAEAKKEAEGPTVPDAPVPSEEQTRL